MKLRALEWLRALRSAARVIALACLCCLAWGCKEKRSERVAASYSSATRPTHPPLPRRALARDPVGLDAIPIEEDYEERAAVSITAANLASKLAELEKEMAF